MASILSDKLGKIGKSPIALKEFSSLKQEMNKLNHPARPDIDWKKVEELCQILLRKNGADLQTLCYYTISLTKLYKLKGLTKGIDYIDTLVSKYWSSFWPEQTHIRVEIIAWLAKSIQQFFRSHQFIYSDLTYIYNLEKLFNHLCQTFQELEIKHLTGVVDLYQLTSKTAKQLERLEQENSISNIISFEKHEQKEEIQTISEKQKEKKLQETNNSRHEIIKPETDYIKITDTHSQQNMQPKKNNFWKGFTSGAFIIAFIYTTIGGAFIYNKEKKIQEIQTVSGLYFPTVLTDNQINLLTQITKNNLSKDIIGNILKNGNEIISQIDIQPLWSLSYSNSLIKLYQSTFPENTQVKELTKQWQKKRQILADQYIQTNSYQTIQSQLQSLIDKLNGLDERKGKYITVSELKSIVFSIQKPLLQSPPLDELLSQMKEQKDHKKDTSTLQQQIDIRFLQLLNYYFILKTSK